MTDWPFSFEIPEGTEKPDPKPIAPGQDPLHWIQDMRCKDPDEILNCIFEGDPLGLRARCPEVMRQHAFMLDPTRLLESAFEEVAFRTSRAELGEIQMDWFDVCIRDACQRLVERDALDPIENLHLDQDERYPEFIVEYFNVRDTYAKQASAEFNVLPLATRQAFFEVYAEGRPVKDYLRQTGETRLQLRTHLKTALLALGHFDPDGIPFSPSPKDDDAEEGL